MKLADAQPEIIIVPGLRVDIAGRFLDGRPQGLMCRVLGPESSLFVQGTPASEIFLTLRGRFKVTRDFSFNDEVRSFRGLFNPRSVLDETDDLEYHETSAISVEPAIVLGIDKKYYSKNLNFLREEVESARRNDYAYFKRFTDQKVLPTLNRIAVSLMAWADYDNGGDRVVHTQADIAEHAETTRANVGKSLPFLKAKGIIKQGRKIELLDFRGLEYLAEGGDLGNYQTSQTRRIVALTS